MTRRTLIPIASLVALIAALGFDAADRVLADEMKVTSSNSTARFIALGVSKSVVIDLPTDIKNVLVGDKGVVTANVVTKRQVYIIGAALGQTNVYFFNADGQQIGALDIAVLSTSPQGPVENYTSHANVVQVVNGSQNVYLNCTPYTCIDALKPGAN